MRSAKTADALTLPQELNQALAAHPDANEALRTLTRGKQRAFAERIARALCRPKGSSRF